MTAVDIYNLRTHALDPLQGTVWQKLEANCHYLVHVIKAAARAVGRTTSPIFFTSGVGIQLEMERETTSASLSKPGPAPASLSPEQKKADADKVLFDALIAIGFYKNIWKFDPIQVRTLLRTLTGLFAVLSLWSWSHIGGYRWMFTSFGLVLGALYWYWFTYVECGGGRLIFSPDWRDSFVRTFASGTNYIVKVNVGYQIDMEASIPFSSFEYTQGTNELDIAWLADEIDQQFPMRVLQK